MAGELVRRDFAGAAISTSIPSSITGAATSITIAASTGWPSGTNGPFAVVIEREGSKEEKVLIATRTGLTLTVASGGRGHDGTAAVAHDPGVKIEVCHTAQDADEANRAMADTIGEVAAQGDILVADAANSLARLAKGTSGLPLVAGAATVAYNQLAAGGIASDAVTTAKILDGNVTTAKLAADAVTSAKITDGTIVAADIATDTITASQIAPDAVGSSELADNAVDTAAIQANAVSAAKFATGTRPTFQNSSAPSSPSEGDIWYETTTERLHVYDGAAWQRGPWFATGGRTGGTWRRAANQSIPNNSQTNILWDTEDADSDAFLTPTSATLTIPTGLGGLYAITAQAAWASDPGSTATFILTAGGVGYRAGLTTGGFAYAAHALTVHVPLVATDTVVASQYQVSGGAINITGRMYVYRTGM